MRRFLSALLLLIGLVSSAHAAGTAGAVASESQKVAEFARYVTAAPSGTYEFINNYDARREGTYLRGPVRSQFNGTLTCNGLTLDNLVIYNDEFVFENPPLGVGFFFQTNSAIVSDCNFKVTTTVTRTSTDGTNQTYRVGGISAYTTDTTWTNVGCHIEITNNSYFSYLACFPNVTTSDFINMDVQGFTNNSIYGNNVINGALIAQMFNGTVTGLRVHDFFGFSDTGTVPATTQNCVYIPLGPECPTTGSYMGSIGVPGFSSLADFVRISNVIVESTVTFSNSTNNGLGNTGCLGGIIFNGIYSDSSADCTVIGGNNVAIFFGSTRLPVGGATGTSEVYNLSGGSAGRVYCYVNTCGRSIATNVGLSHHFYSTALVLAPAAVNVGEIGRNFAFGQAHHFFGWNLISASSAAGGLMGRQDPTSDAVTQGYTMGRVAASSSSGAAIGVCNASPSISALYYNSTWTNQTAACSNIPGIAGVTGLTDAVLAGSLPSGFDGDWIQHPICGYPILAALPVPTCPTAPAATQYLALYPGSGTVTLPASFNKYDNTFAVIGEDGLSGTGTALLAGSAAGSGSFVANFNASFNPGDVLSYQIGTGGQGIKSFIYNASWLLADFGKSASGNTPGTGGTVVGSIGDRNIGGTTGGTGGNCSGGAGAAPGGLQLGGAAGRGGINCTINSGAPGGTAPNSSTTGIGGVPTTTTGGVGGPCTTGTPGTGATVLLAATVGTGCSAPGGGFANSTGTTRAPAVATIVDISGGLLIPPVGYGMGAGGGPGVRSGLATGLIGGAAPGCGASAGGGGYPNGPNGPPAGGCGWIAWTSLPRRRPSNDNERGARRPAAVNHRIKMAA